MPDVDARSVSQQFSFVIDPAPHERKRASASNSGATSDAREAEAGVTLHPAPIREDSQAARWKRH